jgi:parallel beta-helix repeat protein
MEMKWNRLLLCLLGTSLLLACNFSPDMLSPQEEIRGMGESGDTALSTTQEAMTVTVAPDGSGDYTRLDLAVGEVPAGSTVILEAGTFLLTEPLSVTKAITLVGAGMDRTDVVSEAEDYLAHFGGEGPFTAQGITFRHQGDATANVVVMDGGEMDFTLCRFTGGIRDEEEKEGGYGLRIRAKTAGRVQECKMDKNELHGVAIQGQAEVELERNVCSENTQAGIRFSGSSGGTARENECKGNGLSGIIVKDQALAYLDENMCSGNEQNGIAYFEGGGGTAQGNECSGNGMHGISVNDQAQPTLEGNVCRDNSMHGIAVFNQAQPTLEENVCKDNEEVGIRFADTSGGAARQNECSQNKLTGIAVVEEAQPSIEGNICVGNRWGIWVDETANPELVDNDCRDNSEADIEDRSGAAGSRTGLGAADEDEEQLPSTPLAISEASFGPISFSLKVVEGTDEPIDPATSFPAGPTVIHGSFDYEGMTGDTEWTRRWYIDSSEVYSSTEEWGEDPGWNGEPNGRQATDIFWQSGRPLDNGEYELRLYIEDEFMQSGTFVIGSAAPKPSFGPISFSLYVEKDTKEPINPTTVFPVGTARVEASYDYQGMANDIYWTRTWYRDGVELKSTTLRWDESPDDPAWQGKPSGRHANFLFYKSGKPLGSGNYEFLLYIDDQLVQTATFVIE